MKEKEWLAHNQQAWDSLVQQQCAWTQPVSTELVARAKQGDWAVYLTPKPLPRNWLPQDMLGKQVLCLAAGGGQQAPILAAAGAHVTVLDLSDAQLEQDRQVALRDDLHITTVQGDMADLSCFDDGFFDIIIHPISNLYVSDVRVVWRECFRVLKNGGRLLSSFYNPVVFVGDRDPVWAEQGLIKPRYTIPYADVSDLDAAALAQKKQQGSAMVFGHSLGDLIGGQLAAGFVLRDFYEDQPAVSRFVIEQYIPSFLASYACKLKED